MTVIPSPICMITMIKENKTCNLLQCVTLPVLTSKTLLVIVLVVYNSKVTQQRQCSQDFTTIFGLVFFTRLNI